MNQTSVSNFNQPQSQVVICSCPQNHKQRMTHPQREQNADAKLREKKNKPSDDRKHGSGTRKLYSCQRRKRPKHSDRSKWNGCVSWNPIINMPLNLNGQCNIDQAFNNSNSSGDESSDQSVVSDSSSENC